MSTEHGYIYTMDGHVHLTSFWAGDEHAVQLTPAMANPFICLSQADCHRLIIALNRVFDADTVGNKEVRINGANNECSSGREDRDV